jgi:tetratricopeptide (TPR) repeat protein
MILQSICQEGKMDGIRKKLFSAVLIILFALQAPGIRAAGSLLDLADKAWSRRGDLDRTRAAVGYLRQAAQAEPAREDIQVRLAMACYWLGEITPESDDESRLAAYQEGERAALKAIELNHRSVGGNFWSVVNNGRITELKGILSGTFNFGMCLTHMVEVTAQEPDYYYGGIYRYWGRFIYRLPRIGRKIARFSMEDSIQLLNKSLEVDPNFFMTRLYLAESYLESGQRMEAYEQLHWLCTHSPDALLEAMPENEFYQGKARDLLMEEFNGEPPGNP